jgi:PleD family two-component response regulator
MIPASLSLASIDKNKKNCVCSSFDGKPLMNPRCPPPTIHIAQAGEPTPNVLVVDDDPTIHDQLLRLYTHDGYKVVPVSSSEEALQRLAEGTIDLVVTEIKFPGLSGAAFPIPTCSPRKSSKT